VGLPYGGVLTDPVPLPRRGKGYVQIKAPGKHYGTQALVDAIQYAAAEVEKERPGPALQVGDLSGMYGGRIPNHRSHRSGRDVDFIFYATNLGGAPVPAQGWTCYGPDGIGVAHAGPHGRIYLRLDLERNWLLVKALLHAPSANVMWLFVSKPIKALLTEYALARGEDPVLVWQAENVMLQPRNSLPHDDHFHLRIMCPEGSGVHGCEEGGPFWPWLDPAPSLFWPETSADIASFLEVDSFPPL
jgi:penicillin-insensitive murein endopeptidase